MSDLFDVYAVTARLLRDSAMGEVGSYEEYGPRADPEGVDLAALVVLNAFHAVARRKFTGRESLEEITDYLRDSIQRWGDVDGLLVLREAQAVTRVALGEERIWSAMDPTRAMHTQFMLFVNIVRDLGMSEQEIDDLLDKALAVSREVALREAAAQTNQEKTKE